MIVLKKVNTSINLDNYQQSAVHLFAFFKKNKIHFIYNNFLSFRYK